MGRWGDLGSSFEKPEGLESLEPRGTGLDLNAVLSVARTGRGRTGGGAEVHWEPVGSRCRRSGRQRGEPWLASKYISKVEQTGLDVGWREGEESREIAQDLV